MIPYSVFVALLTTIIVQQQVTGTYAALGDGFPKAVLKILDDFLFTTVARLNGQKPFNVAGSYGKFSKFAYEDTSNEEASTLSLQELIARAGFRYENHYVLSDDGYITQLTRLINPRVRPHKLRQPPVAMFHGGLINPTAYVVASNIQHYPERYPQLPGDYHTSSNRSIAFVLANNGFDVWLIGTRGASRENQGHLKYKVMQLRGFKNEWTEKSSGVMNVTQSMAGLFRYWDFTMDDIGEFEIPAQVDKILEVTGAEKVTLFTFSLSTMTCLPVLASNEEFSKKVHNLVLMAPIINSKGANIFSKIVHRVLAHFDYNLGTIIFSLMYTSQWNRNSLLRLAEDRDIRYTVVKALAGYLVGSSPKFYTLLEGPVLGHIFEPVGAREGQHYIQQVLAKRLQKYDWGLFKNQQKYGQPIPPAYDLGKITINNWMLVHAENDNMATSASVRQVLEQIPAPPKAQSFYPRASHLDIFAGFENDKYVNLPILKYLIGQSLPPLKKAKRRTTALQKAQQQRLITFIPADTNNLRE